MWWLLGIGGLYVGLKLVAHRQKLIDVTIGNMEAKIRHHRELARKGNRESLNYLKSLDAVVERLSKAKTASGTQIVSVLQYDGLYPPSAI